MTSHDLITNTRYTITDLQQRLSALPDPDDIGAPKQRDRVSAIREMLRAESNHLHQLLHFVTDKPDPQPLIEWRELLTTAITDFENELVKLEDSHDDDQRPRDRRMVQVRHALRTLQNGPEVYPSGEAIPDALVSYFASHHVDAPDGRWFRGRGGLRQVTVKIEDLQRDRSLAEKELAHYLSAYTAELEKNRAYLVSLSSSAVTGEQLRAV